MNPFVESLHKSIVEDIRLLEVFVTAPLGLYSDVKMLRESLKLDGTEDLSQPDSMERRTSFRSITKDGPGLALGTIGHLSQALDSLDAFDGAAIAPVTSEWITRARMVLTRAEEKIGDDVRAATAAKVKGLYVVVGPDATNGRPILEVAAAALKGGAKVIQLRDKTTEKGALLETAKKMKSLCDQHHALFIVNDDADIAMLSDAHGLHLGQGDLPIASARAVLKPGQLIGRSNNTVDEAVQAQADGADYLAIGAVFATDTMGKSERKTVGVDVVKHLKEIVSPPVVAIGGITAANIADVVRTGADSVCVVSAVTLAANPEAASKALVAAIESAKS